MRLIALLMALLFGSAAYADTLTMPYTFVPSTPILSAQVNGNFAAVTSWSTRITNANIKANAGILPNKLDLTQSFPVLRAAGFTCFSAGNTGDSNPRWLVTADGFMQMGPGGATAADVTLKRKAASTFSVRNAADSAYGTMDAATHNSFAAASDANPTVSVTTTGINFGAGGASAVDTLFKRESATTLAARNAADAAYADIKGAAITGTSIVGGTVAGTTGTFSGAVSGTTITGSGALQGTALTLTTTPLATTYGGTGADLSATTAGQFVTRGSGSVMVGSTGVGGPGNAGTSGCATTGTIYGSCFHRGAWTTTGAITCQGCHIHATGNITVAHGIDASSRGFSAGSANAINVLTPNQMGNGPAPGKYTSAAGVGGGGGGGGCPYNDDGGAAGGGRGGSAVANVFAPGGGESDGGGSWAGSGGGGGAPAAAAVAGINGGNGGGVIILESGGNITVTSGVSSGGITAAGGAGADNTGAGGGGGGGGGGTIALLCSGTITLDNANQLTCDGGDGGDSGTAGGGGGGGGGMILLRASAYVISAGSLDPNTNTTGGVGGAGSATTTAGSGSTGVIDQRTETQGSAPFEYQ